MARSISWQPRLNEMHRQVSSSARTPYTRADVERLFRVQDRTARKLMELIPRVEQGNATVVEREELLAFLAGAIDAEDLQAYLDEIKAKPPKPSRRKIRLFVPRDFVQGKLQPLTVHNIWLKRGRLEMTWTDRDDCFSKMMMLVSSMSDPDFERRYCHPPIVTPKAERDAGELKLIRAEDRYLVKLHALYQSMREGHTEIAELFRAEAKALLIDVRDQCEKLGREFTLLDRAAEMTSTLFPDLMPPASSPSGPSAVSTAPPAPPPADAQTL